MKKIFLFASLLAMAAVLATSCKPKVQDPKARFGYEAEDLTVKFTNLSQNADAYAWDFGDGATSTEKDPVHVYADYGDYTVKLTAKNEAGENTFTDEVSLVKRAIAIDGDFSDWVALDAQVAKCVADENAVEDYFYAAKFIRDADFIYFYLEFSNSKGDDPWDTEEGLVEDYAVKHVSLWLDFGDATGCTIWWWDDQSWIDFLIEGSWEDQFESASVDQCPEDLNGGDNSEWTWVSTGVSGAVSSCEAQDLGEGHLAIEGKIMVGMLPLQPTDVVRMGIGALAPDWDTYAGRLPQTTANDDGSTTLGHLPDVPVVQ